MARRQTANQSPVTDRGRGALLETCDLVVDRIYESGRSGNAGDDRISRLLGVSNQGGFRYLGAPDAIRLIVITSNFVDPDWPDSIDKESGLLVYFGDNKHPGRGLHETPRRGNLLLRNVFELTHKQPPQRDRVPPILVFRNTGHYRDAEFLGLAVPGAEGFPPTESLVAVWRVAEDNRFQNYRAIFTILSVPCITREWIDDIRSGQAHSGNAPSVWTEWIMHGRYTPLQGTRTVEHRTRREQLPDNDSGMAVVKAIHEHFRDDPVGFEKCAVAITRMMDPNFRVFQLTRPSRDGGRDAIGKYRIGHGASAIDVDCALEAKCYAPEHAVGVKELARLISRLRHRQFGVLVTTSYVHQQAYREIKDDGHPVVIISAGDIVRILARGGISRTEEVAAWLSGEFQSAIHPRSRSGTG